MEFLFTISLVDGFCVTVMYWIVVFDGKFEHDIEYFTKIFPHGISWMLIMIEFSNTYYIPRYTNYFLVLIYQVCYSVFVGIYTKEMNFEVYSVLTFNDAMTYGWLIIVILMAASFYFGVIRKLSFCWKKSKIANYLM